MLQSNSGDLKLSLGLSSCVHTLGFELVIENSFQFKNVMGLGLHVPIARAMGVFRQQAQEALSSLTWQSSSCVVHFCKPIQSDTCHALGKGSWGGQEWFSCLQSFWSVLSRLPGKLEPGETKTPEPHRPGSILAPHSLAM